MRSLVHRCSIIPLLAILFATILTIAHVSITAPTTHATASGFVTRSGSQLELGGSTFRFSGADMEWLGAAPEDPYQINDALTTLNEMGGTVARSLWLTSLGSPNSLQPSLGTYNSAAFARIDYAIKAASDHGIHLIIPLVDGNANGDGSYAYYTQWRHISNTSQFFTNTTVIGDFESFISHYLNHVNSLTGIAYKNDPTVLAWETGNEISPPQSWSQTISDYIKSIDTNHLIASGPTPPGINSSDLNVSSIDIEDEHFYPMQVSDLNTNAATVTNAGKVFIAGEYDWAGYSQGGSTLSAFLSAIESNSNVSGDLFWELFPHADVYGFAPYNAGALGLALGFHYPGDTADMQTRAQQLRTHAFTMSGISTPPAHIVPGAPVVDQVIGQDVYWRGATGASSYSVQRSTSSGSGPWTTICNECTTDTSAPYVDSSQPSGQVWYRVGSYSISGVAGSYSQGTQAQGDAIFANNGFETPALSSGSYQYAPSGGSWTFSSSAGISTNGSPFTSGNPNAPEGSQVAVLQGTGSISINVTLQTNTNYCMTFFAAQRGNYNNGGEDFSVVFDGIVSVGTFTPAGSSYTAYATLPINVTTSSHSIAFVGLDSAGGDNTALIDSVRMVLC